MIYSEAKTGDWLRIKSQPISNIYIKSEDSVACCIYSDEKNNIGEVYTPAKDEIVFFVSSFWVYDISFPIFSRKSPSRNWTTLPKLFIIKYKAGYRYYLTIDTVENQYLVISTEENSDYIRLGHFETIPANTCVNTCLELVPKRLIFPEKTKLLPAKEVKI